MPLPERTPSETKQEYLQRCMGDKTMVREYPDNKQRYAVCISKSRKK